MLELALKSDKEEGTLQKEIAENQDVSLKYLDHIIASLKSAGLIVNAGGKKSGYRLNRPAEEISIYDVYSALVAIRFRAYSTYVDPGVSK